MDGEGTPEERGEWGESRTRWPIGNETRPNQHTIGTQSAHKPGGEVSD